MYLRFVQHGLVDGMHAREGILQVAGQLSQDPLVPASVQVEIKKICEWFNENLSAPNRFSKSRAKGQYRRRTKGLSWLKPTATEHVAKAFELGNLLEGQGCMIEVLKAHRVGHVVYEDKHQVVAEPFATTPAS